MSPKGIYLPVHPPSAEALFRLVVVCLVLSREQNGEKRVDAVKKTASEVHRTLDGALRRPGKRTVYRWLAAYERKGLAGLEPARRTRTQSSEVLTNQFLAFFAGQKKADPSASIPEIIKRAQHLGVLKEDEQVHRSTVWRAGRRMGLDLQRRRHAPKARDARRWAHRHRMMLLLCDGKHFRVGPSRVRRVALFFLDDASRYGLHVVVGTAESAVLFLRGLYRVTRKYGRMRAVYLDHGPGFIAHDTLAAVGRLGANWIGGETGYPPGRGKIERFNRRALAECLGYLDENPDVDPDCGALELRLQHWLHEDYNNAPHESLDGITPRQRWHEDGRKLEFVESEEDLRRCFVVVETRRVSNDNAVPYEGVDYEVPVGHRGEKIELQRHVVDGSVSMVHEGRLVTLAPVDLNANATSGRAQGRTRDDDAPPRTRLPSAAELSYAREFEPVVGPDGGFIEPTTDTDKE